jgi:hypothetical protein
MLEYIPSRPYQVLCLYLAGAHLAIFGTLFDFGDQLLLLVLQLHSFTIQLSLSLFESALMLSETLSWGDLTTEGPL